MTDRTPPRRPAMWEPTYIERIEGGVDPAVAFAAAHDSARILLRYGNDTTDPQVRQRLIDLVQTEGIEVIASVWSHSAPSSLPGALWRLYAVREWIIRCGDDVASRYNRGLHASEVSHAVAGVASLHGPQEVRETIDEIFAGVFTADIDVAFDRVAALIRVVIAGSEPGHLDQRDKLATTAADLAHAARRARSGDFTEEDSE